jgi:LysR family transcriptional activator of nhaA
VLLPSLDSDIRVAFDRMLEVAGIRPIVLAEVDDMAMLRLLAREREGVTLVPPIVVRDELETGVLVEYCRIPDVTERFYAVTQKRRFPSRLLGESGQAFAPADHQETRWRARSFPLDCSKGP